MDEGYLKDIIRRVQEKKSSGHHSPDYAMTEEIRKEINDDMLEGLRNLCRKHEIEYHKTLNNVAFSLT
jgi:hypothetical protein